MPMNNTFVPAILNEDFVKTEIRDAVASYYPNAIPIVGDITIEDLVKHAIELTRAMNPRYRHLDENNVDEFISRVTSQLCDYIDYEYFPRALLSSR